MRNFAKGKAIAGRLVFASVADLDARARQTRPLHMLAQANTTCQSSVPDKAIDYSVALVMELAIAGLFHGTSTSMQDLLTRFRMTSVDVLQAKFELV